MSETLLPCPFCGGKAESVDNGKWEPVIDKGGAYVDCDIKDPTWYGVQCTKCFCQLVSEEYTDKEEAIAAWNRRAQATEIEQRWISVEERPPKSEKLVIVTDGHNIRATDLMQNGEWRTVIDPTHWMPLPKLPELCEGGAK